ncbi:MAG TPA: hypothetical protein VG223_11685 [Solirubrobacteraceae bacterium]|nr:hypothetical protein [Solirubrobacteraceae bacterium]
MQAGTPDVAVVLVLVVPVLGVDAVLEVPAGVELVVAPPVPVCVAPDGVDERLAVTTVVPPHALSAIMAAHASRQGARRRIRC